jgi:formate-nitrite transporter family protein
MATQHNVEEDDMLEREPREIAEEASDVGVERLDRGNLEILLTSIIGGGEVSIGSLAAMTIVGALLVSFPGLDVYAALAVGGLAFPIGFVFVIVGRSELFTENFLIPVVAVFDRQRSLGSLAQLWALSWIGNLIGCAGTAALLLVPEAIGQTIHYGFDTYTNHKVSVPLTGVFASAALAGGVMSAMTWMLLSVHHPLGRMLAIWSGGYVLFAANLAHSIVSASVLMVGFVGARTDLLALVMWLLVATAGNLVGGIGLVTLFRVTQAREQRKSP